MTGTLSRDTGATTQVDERLGAEARDFLGRPHQLFIDGQWVDAADGRTFGTYDPATGAEITQVAHGGPEDVNRAVAAARRDRAAVGLVSLLELYHAAERVRVDGEEKDDIGDGVREGLMLACRGVAEYVALQVGGAQ